MKECPYSLSFLTKQSSAVSFMFCWCSQMHTEFEPEVVTGIHNFSVGVKKIEKIQMGFSGCIQDRVPSVDPQ